MDDKLLKSLHEYLLIALIDVDRICRKYGIKYYIVAGTLLGAVRHGGFIPWDDDLDIGMMRPDYERFLSIAEKELNSRYFLQTSKTDKEYFLCFSKIRINNTRLIEKFSADVKIHQGIYIDIFPFDNVPNLLPMRKLHRFFTKLFIMAAMARSAFRLDDNDKKDKHLLYSIVGTLARPFRLTTILKTLDRLMRISSNSSSEYVVNIGGAYGYNKEALKREYFNETVDVDFEGYKIMAPYKWHEYLRDFYGDYMTPPPVDKRYNRHNIVEITFEDEMDKRV